MVKNGNPRKKGLGKLVYHLSDSLCKYLMIPVFNIGRTFLPFSSYCHCESVYHPFPQC